MALVVDTTREWRMEGEQRGGSSKMLEETGLSEFEPAGAPDDDPLTRNLKRVYEQVAAEPIPEEWLGLLEQIDKKARERKT